MSRAAGGAQTEAAASAEANFFVDQGVGKQRLELHRQTNMAPAGAPGDGLPCNLHGPIKKHPLDPGVPASLFHNARVDFFEEPGNGRGNRGADLQKGLGDFVDGVNVGEGGALKNVDVVDGAAVNVGEREERESDVYLRVKMKILAEIGDVGAKVGVREHHALGFARGAGSVDKRGELAGKNLRGAHPVRGNVRATGAGDKGFVTETIAGERGATIDRHNVIEFRAAGANG